LVSGVLLFVMAILAINKNEAEDLFHKKDFVAIEDSLENETAQEIKEDISDKIDVEHYMKKLLPKEDSKLGVLKYSEKVLSNFAKEFDIVQGLFYIREKGTDQFSISGKYAYFGETEPEGFKLGQSLPGQTALNKTILYLNDIPENFVTILSGLGSSSPRFLVIIPVVFNNETIAVIELASFKELKKSWQKIFENVAQKIGESLSKNIL